jgi:predicted DNA binding CopG/RHH family protein
MSNSHLNTCIQCITEGVLAYQQQLAPCAGHVHVYAADVRQKADLALWVAAYQRDGNDVEVIADFLPSPAELAFREDGVKVTLSLSKSSVAFFKSEASKHQTQYQRMIRRLLDSYVQAQNAAASKPKPTVRKRAPI